MGHDLSIIEIKGIRTPPFKTAFMSQNHGVRTDLKILYRGENISILQFLMQISIIIWIWISIFFDWV